MIVNELSETTWAANLSFSRPRNDVRNALLCGLLVIFSIALTNPVSEFSFNDDWSYALTVEKLHEAGRLTYNGWASASLIAQAYYGLLWVRAFGYSQTVLRLSTIPLAGAAVSFCYLLGRRVGLRSNFAVFATLLVGLSPLYLPVAGSFMTDAPGLFFTLLCMYLLSRSMDSKRTGRAILWLAGGLFAGFVGGTSRQIVWLAPLALGTYTAWIRRGNRPFALVSLLGTGLVLLGAMLTMRWFTAQPYSIPEARITTDIQSILHKPAHFAMNVLAVVLTTIWMILPALWGMTRRWKPKRIAVTSAILLGTSAILGLTRPNYLIAPWMENTLAGTGVMARAEMAGDRPQAIPLTVRIISAIAVFAAASVFAADFVLWIAQRRDAMRQAVRFFLQPKRPITPLPAMALFAAGYFLLLLPRCAADMAYDRYVIPLMPCVLFPLLLKYQKCGELKIPLGAWALLGIFGVYSIAATQDVTALGRARAAAAARLTASGVPRTQIDGGFEYDYQTQVLATGFINDPRIRNPRGAFKEDLGPTYCVQALYRLEFAPATDTAPTPFGSVSYFSYLYPFHRMVYIDRFIDPWWFDPARAATRPADSRHRMVKLTAEG